MKILINKDDKWSLITAPETSLEKLKTNSDEVVTSFEMSDDQETYINSGASFSYSETDGITIEDEQIEVAEANIIASGKATAIQEYNVLQNSIKSKKADIVEIEDRYDDYNDTYKAIADARMEVLEDSLTTLRAEQDELVMTAVETYGSDILNDL